MRVEGLGLRVEVGFRFRMSRFGDSGYMQVGLEFGVIELKLWELEGPGLAYHRALNPTHKIHIFMRHPKINLL